MINRHLPEQQPIYTWQYRKGNAMANADALSRIPLKSMNDVGDYVHIFSVTDELPISADEIRKETSQDLVLSKVLLCTRY